jgi:hypothetical protein
MTLPDAPDAVNELRSAAAEHQSAALALDAAQKRLGRAINGLGDAVNHANGWAPGHHALAVVGLEVITVRPNRRIDEIDPGYEITRVEIKPEANTCRWEPTP